MRKSEIRLSYHTGTRGLPMLNVKRYVDRDDALRVIDTHPEFAGPELATFRAWSHLPESCAGPTNRDWDNAEEMAREDGWAQAEGDADMHWPGRGLTVYSAGRSGGWLVVKGLRDVEEWDAIHLGKWAAFAKDVAGIVDAHAYRIAWHLMANVWEHSPTYRAAQTLNVA